MGRGSSWTEHQNNNCALLHHLVLHNLTRDQIYTWMTGLYLSTTPLSRGGHGRADTVPKIPSPAPTRSKERKTTNPRDSKPSACRYHNPYANTKFWGGKRKNRSALTANFKFRFLAPKLLAEARIILTLTLTLTLSLTLDITLTLTLTLTLNPNPHPHPNPNPNPNPSHNPNPNPDPNLKP
ncbi:hypothetical protein PoB_001235400 [Plakobranchus ocellatus]|uniref:Uncharacterized protein n=1 Tax=Plakobranchus ocellatus TaxID=259542 RepID=A0AAV3YUZ0_9GAST|nr:hypothetical protein PoB_001235400 [Plakobranchus ocellatus]